jgi:trehalose 6-phosphate synthase/phosphatase
MLLPELLRQRLPAARIGFFLHVPFPSSEIFRILPWRGELLRGLLGADLIGFHTFAYMRHFLASLLHIDGVEADIDRVRIGKRDVKLGVFPMGIDAAQFSALACEPAVLARAQEIRRDAAGRRIILGIDRLDYTKGIPRRLEAIERLFQRHPDARDAVRYVQVAVPSRGRVDAYQDFKRQVEECVGRINGACATLQSTPVHYLHTSVSQEELVALYRAADIMMVTPLRDGMNLVAKEFAASRTDDDGVLLLSEFAGAAAELDGALVVNPYDVDGVAETIHRALNMRAAERRARMRRLRHRVHRHSVHMWAQTFLDRLALARPEAPRHTLPRPEPSLAAMLIDGHARTTLRLLVDYDGTLVPLVRSPELATPDSELLMLLEQLAHLPGVRLDLVSGRPRDTLERWFGYLPIALWGEHGFWHRARSGHTWTAAATIPHDWPRQLLPILEQFTAATPGSHIERKSASIAWHYRGAQREFGTRQAHELRMLLGDTLSNQPFEVLEGKKVIEIRLRGVSKAAVAHQVRQEIAEGTLIVAIGDDLTDDELFRALPASSITVGVGSRPESARFHLPDPRAVRQALRALADTAGETPAHARVDGANDAPLAAWT